MERARTEWLRAAGFTHNRLSEEENLVFVVSNMNIDFKKPAYFDELLNVNSRIVKQRGTSLVFEQIVENDENEIKCRADVNIACVDSRTFKPKRIPESIRTEFNHDI